MIAENDLEIHNYAKSLVMLLEPYRRPKIADPMKQYMKNRFDFLGIQRPQRQLVLKKFLAEYGLPDPNNLGSVLQILWSYGYREYQYCGLELLYKLIKKVDKRFIARLEALIVKKSWWDTVDMLAQKCVGPHFIRFPDLISTRVEAWTTSKNIWLVRTAILFQNRYKEKTDFGLLTSIVIQFIDSEEFFIQKAIGWALREYAKTNPYGVLAFIESKNVSNLAKSSPRHGPIPRK